MNEDEVCRGRGFACEADIVGLSSIDARQNEARHLTHYLQNFRDRP